MTLKSKFKTIFEFIIFNLCHIPNLIAVGCAPPQAMTSTKRPQPDTVKTSNSSVDYFKVFEIVLETISKNTKREIIVFTVHKRGYSSVQGNTMPRLLVH